VLGAPVPCMQAVHVSVGCVVVLCLVCAAVLHFTVQQVNPKDCEWAVLFLWSTRHNVVSFVTVICVSQIFKGCRTKPQHYNRHLSDEQPPALSFPAA
jgi:hypothetical protein